MFYAAFPPEINSGRIYSGAGAQPMVTAAAAWSDLAAELQSTAASYAAVISALTSGPWLGPSALRMAAAVAPYLSWMQATAVQAAETASQANAAVSAYEAALRSHVPPADIAANRARLAQLVATDVIGQNLAAIAATEVEYDEMWAQDAVAMDGYAASSAAATKLTPYAEPPPTTDASGTAGQSALAAASAGSPLLQWLADVSADYTSTINGVLNSLFGPTGASTFTALFAAVRAPLSLTSQFNAVGLLTNFPVSQFLKFAPAPGFALPPKEALGGGLSGPWFGRGWLTGAVSADMGTSGTLVGRLSVPPSWAVATPAIRTVAAALSAGAETVPAAALGEAGLFSSMSTAGMLGSAIGAGMPKPNSGNGIRGRIAPLKDLENRRSPQELKRLVAQISDNPESVQHHTVDQDGLDSLLEQLAKKPGIHAVHLSKSVAKKAIP